MTATELREARKALGLTQAKISARLGVSHRMYKYWEGGKWPVPETVSLAVQWLIYRLYEYGSLY